MSKSRKKSSRYEEEKRRKTKHILESAITVIAEKGYHAATVADIARAADVASGSIYNYFDSKEHILIQIFEVKMAELTDSVRATVEQFEDPLAQIRAFITHHFEHLQKSPDLAQVFQVELRQSQHFFKTDYEPKRLLEYLGVLQKSIALGQEQGVLLKTVDRKLLQWSLFGAMDELSTNWVLTSRQSRSSWPANLEGLPSQLMQMFVEGVRDRSGQA